ENLLMGYQLVFTLTVVFISLFALLAAYSDALAPATAALAGAGLLVPIALGGGQGLSFVPALGCWVVWQMYRAVRGGSYEHAALAGLLVTVVVGYAGFAAYEQFTHATQATIRNGPAETLRVAAQVLGIGLGPLGMYQKLWVGWVVLAAGTVTALWLSYVFVRRPEERPVPFRLL